MIDKDGPPCQGNCPNHGCVESLASGTALAREALRRRPRAARVGARAGAGRGPRARRAARHRARPRRRPDRDRGARADRHQPGRRAGQPREHLQPRGDRDRRRRDRAPASCCSSRPGAEVARRALPPSRDEVRIVAAQFGVEAGMVGAAALAFDGLARAGGVRMSSGAADRLPDADRQPRGRHPARARGAARGRPSSPARTPAARACCSTATASARTWSATTSTTSSERAAELVARMREGAVVALVSDAGMPLVSDPGFVLVRACVAAGLAVEVLPGPSAALAALVASALPAERWRFAGFLPRKRSRADRGVLLARDAGRVRVAAPGGGVAGRARRDRPRAPGRGLPRADQDPRGGRARHAPPSWPSATATNRPGARSCSSSAPPRPAPATSGPALDAVRAADRRRRQAAPGGVGRRRAHRPQRQRAVPALTERAGIARRRRSAR